MVCMDLFNWEISAVRKYNFRVVLKLLFRIKVADVPISLNQ
jgi:hypothetical protein